MSDRPKRMPKARLIEAGYSPKSERYEYASGETISKRQYQQRYITGGKSLLQRARDYLAGVVEYATAGLRHAAEARRRYAGLRRKFKERMTPAELAVHIKVNRQGYSWLWPAELETLEKFRAEHPDIAADWRAIASPKKDRRAAPSKRSRTRRK